MEQVLIGKILKPKGLDGTLKVTNFSLGELANNIKCVFACDKYYNVLRVYTAKEFVYFKVDGINSIEDAEKFRGKYLYADRSELGLNNNQYIATDFLNMEVYTENEKLGKVTDVETHANRDILLIKTRRGEFLVPFADGLVESVDLGAKRLYINEKTYNEVKCEN